MDENKTFQEIDKIKKELRSIIAELNDISNDIETEFSGVGNHRCARCIRDVTSEYNRVVRRLNTIDEKDL